MSLAIKQLAAGRWTEILSALGGIDAALLDGKHHPCPKCGGVDRFRMIDAEAGALYCNQCLTDCGDGLAALQWAMGWTFSEAVDQLAAWLGTGQPEKKKDGKKMPRRIVATYDYRDEAGHLLFQVVRLEPKGFLQRAPTPGGGWTWRVKGVRKVLYRLPELLAAPKDRTVWIPEGEKDCDKLRTYGFVSTTNPGGAGKWRDEYAEWLAGRPVVILPDNDEPGRDHAEEIAARLAGRGPSIKVVLLPDGKDVTEWLDKGHMRGELESLVAAASQWQPPARPPAAEQMGSAPPTRGFALTDTGLAERFAKQHAEIVRYCHPWAKWLAWDSRRWREDDTGAVDRLAKDTVRGILSEAAAEENAARRRALENFARRSEASAKRAAMLGLARCEQPLPVLPGILDQDPWALNLLNGTLDLKTGLLRPHRQVDFLTKLAPVEWLSASQCPLWMTFLERIFDGNSRLIRFVQRLLGYCLTATVGEQVLPIFWGRGANGKSTLVNVVLKLLGTDYAMKAPPDFLMAHNQDVHPTERADLFGKRFIACLETEEGRRLAESLAKDLTGGDRIRARRMREDFWEFDPTHKAVLVCNHKPIIRGTDEAIWRRIRMVPFTVIIPEGERDRNLPDKLLTELPGILLWLVCGCLEWQTDGLDAPPEVLEATGEYRSDQDALAKFLAECCVCEPWAKCKAAVLLKRFREWSGNLHLSQRQFGTMLLERGFDRYTSAGTWYRGVGLEDETEEESRQRTF